MKSCLVTAKGQVTIPHNIRQRLGICHGSRIQFEVVGEHIELRLEPKAGPLRGSGFGMLKSSMPSIPADFDPFC